MMKSSFEKFEKEYLYKVPEDFINFIDKFGTSTKVGNCIFSSVEDIVSNNLRVSSKMDFHLLPFGKMENGDLYSFYRYGSEENEYFIGLWIKETRNFVILASNFKAFLYKSTLDEYLSISDISDEKEKDWILDKVKNLCDEYSFDIDKIKKVETVLDYHSEIVDFDNKALQSLCYLGKNHLDNGDEKGVEYLEKAKEVFAVYAAPYYILGKYYGEKELTKGKVEFLTGMRTSYTATGYTHWKEEYLDIPKKPHGEMANELNGLSITSGNFFELSIIRGKDPYSYVFMLEVAERHRIMGDYKKAMRSYANSLYCCEKEDECKAVLKEAYECSLEGGISYLSKILKDDMEKINL